MDSQDLGKDLLVETAKVIAGDVYKDGLQKSVKNVGDALGTFTGFFNHVVLYPLKNLNKRFEAQAIAFEKELELEYNKIPLENRVDSPVNVLGPILESLKYNMDEEEMKKMFKRLLLNSMDSRKRDKVHPIYVDIISKMNTLDAKLFKVIASKKGYLPAILPSMRIKGTDKFFSDALPEWYIGINIPNYTIFDISASLVRLGSSGIIELLIDRTAGKARINPNNEESLLAYLNRYRIENPTLDLELHGMNSVYYTNDFGKGLYACIK